ncbi:hypothetical protein SAMN02910317_02026 [Ruminococcaceae bacterium FB2012]|nr:hypothetical protein SAMN02910317_02026 [Ruminococcaceae bacterium FB2012]
MAKKKNSVQSLIGFERFTNYGIRTDKAEIAFFSVEPTNISVLSAVSVDTKIHRMMSLLTAVPELEIIATDSCEYFDSNKAYIKERLAKEQNEAVRKLLEADMEYLDSIQVEMSTARQFLFAVRFRKEKESFIFNRLNEIGKVIKDNGFIAHRLDKAEIKRMLALYFGTSITGDMIEDVEGEKMIMKGVNDNEGETEKLGGE